MFQAQFKHQSDDFGDILSSETIQYHYGKHHIGYAESLNSLIKGTRYCDLKLEQIIVQSQRTDRKIFNSASQLYNHDFYWKCLTNQYKEPGRKLLAMANEQFGCFENLKREYIAYANTMFGSGWSWLVTRDGELYFLNTTNADNPVGSHAIPLCVVDLWEHAYYIDYRNKRNKYIEELVENCIDWEFCESQI